MSSLFLYLGCGRRTERSGFAGPRSSFARRLECPRCSFPFAWTTSTRPTSSEIPLPGTYEVGRLLVVCERAVADPRCPQKPSSPPRSSPRISAPTSAFPTTASTRKSSRRSSATSRRLSSPRTTRPTSAMTSLRFARRAGAGSRPRRSSGGRLQLAMRIPRWASRQRKEHLSR